MVPSAAAAMIKNQAETQQGERRGLGFPLQQQGTFCLCRPRCRKHPGLRKSSASPSATVKQSLFMSCPMFLAARVLPGLFLRLALLLGCSHCCSGAGCIRVNLWEPDVRARRVRPPGEGSVSVAQLGLAESRSRLHGTLVSLLKPAFLSAFLFCCPAAVVEIWWRGAFGVEMPRLCPIINYLGKAIALISMPLYSCLSLLLPAQPACFKDKLVLLKDKRLPVGQALLSLSPGGAVLTSAAS